MQINDQTAHSMQLSFDLDFNEPVACKEYYAKYLLKGIPGKHGWVNWLL